MLMVLSSSFSVMYSEEISGRGLSKNQWRVRGTKCCSGWKCQTPIPFDFDGCDSIDPSEPFCSFDRVQTKVRPRKRLSVSTRLTIDCVVVALALAAFVALSLSFRLLIGLCFCFNCWWSRTPLRGCFVMSLRRAFSLLCFLGGVFAEILSWAGGVWYCIVIVPPGRTRVAHVSSLTGKLSWL